MKLHNVIITILLVSLIILGITDYTTSMGTNYGVTADTSSLNSTLTRLDKVRNDSVVLAETIEDIKLTSVGEAFEIPYELIKAGWYGVRLMFGSYTTVGAMTTDISTGLSENGIALPDWLIVSIVPLIVIILVALIIYLFFKYKAES